tara:strand:- start:255 stop:524 length:270 start_codon:yes stop_codon:yes gene_type:complete
MVTMSKNKIEKIYKKKKMIITHYGEDIELNEEDIKYEIYDHFMKRIVITERELVYQQQILENWKQITWVSICVILSVIFAFTVILLLGK